MKQILNLSILALVFSSCSMQKQASTATGRTDEVYFTVNDTRKKASSTASEYQGESLQDKDRNSNAGNYTSSYSNRLRNFGSSQRFNYSNYQPVLVQTMFYNPYTGWSIGMSYVDPDYGYMGGYNSPFSPYYGYYMPYGDPFYTYGWGGSWMTGYYPYYTYNPYYFNGCGYGWGYGRGYGYYGYNRGQFYNNYNYYNRPSGGASRPNYSRRTGSSNNQPYTQPSQQQNSGNNNNNNNSGNGKWYDGGNSDRGGSSGSSSGGSWSKPSSGSSGSSGGSGSSSGGNSDRGSSGSGGSTRRR